eukprot:c28072_g1_i3 orf=532-3054(-)
MQDPQEQAMELNTAVAMDGADTDKSSSTLLALGDDVVSRYVALSASDMLGLGMVLPNEKGGGGTAEQGTSLNVLGRPEVGMNIDSGGGEESYAVENKVGSDGAELPLWQSGREGVDAAAVQACDEEESFCEEILASNGMEQRMRTLECRSSWPGTDGEGEEVKLMKKRTRELSMETVEVPKEKKVLEDRAIIPDRGLRASKMSDEVRNRESEDDEDAVNESGSHRGIILTGGGSEGTFGLRETDSQNEMVMKVENGGCVRAEKKSVMEDGNPSHSCTDIQTTTASYVEQHAGRGGDNSSQMQPSQVSADGECVVSSENNQIEETKPSEENEEEMLKKTACRVRPPKRRKIAMFIAYCGVGYQGMQKNPGAVTIEGDLEEALFKAGAISESHYGDYRKSDWMRAARTDKGVSAVGQVVSGLFCVDPPGFVDRVNSHLSKQIRVLGYKRAIPSFNAKKYCDRRRYEYVIPVFAFDSSVHRDRESVLASEGKDGAFAKCLECSERGRKVLGALGKGCGKALNMSKEGEEKEILMEENPTSAKNTGTIGIMEDQGCNETAPVFSSEVYEDAHGHLGLAIKEDSSQGELISGAVSTVAVVSNDKHGTPITHRDRNRSEKQNEVGYSRTEKHACSMSEESVATLGASGENTGDCPFLFGEVHRDRINHILSHYVGTHNFHNFTTRVRAEDPSAQRYIVSFETSEPFSVCNMEFVRCRVVGQSFMLHQIRKMIGLAIAIFRDCAPESMLDTALRSDTRVNVPTAPELGLFLDECMYPAYNQKWSSLHGEISQRGFEEEINQFKNNFIYTHIAATELKEGVMALFLHSLNDRNFPDFVTAREAEGFKG